MKAKKTMNGFTLLELLIAIALFTLIATACYRLLTTSTQSEITTTKVWDGLRTFQKGRLIIQKDVNQVVARPIRNSEGDRQFAMSGPVVERDKKILMTFSRSGWHNLLGAPRSDLQRVSYVFENDQLVRYYWPVMDLAVRTLPIKQVVMDRVTHIKVEFLDQKNRWSSTWPPVSEEQKVRMIILPAAIRMALVHEYYGSLEWWFVGVGMPPKKIKANADKDEKTSDDNKQKGSSSTDDDEDDEGDDE